jgi:hypothetical protein
MHQSSHGIGDMSLAGIIEQTAGALQQIGARVGLVPKESQRVIGRLAPDLAPRIAEHATEGGRDEIPTLANALTPGSVEGDEHGKSILGSLSGAKDVSRDVAAKASAETASAWTSSRRCFRSLRRSQRWRWLRTK